MAENSDQVKQVARLESKGGVLAPNSIEQHYRLAQYYHASGLMPRGLNSPEKILVAMQFLYEQKLPVVSCIKSVAVINGSVSIFGDLPLALAQRTKEIEDMEEWWFGPDEGPSCSSRLPPSSPADQVLGATCRIKRKGRLTETIRSFTIEDAKLAKLWMKTDPWMKYPKRMLQMRARSWALKDLFPDIIGAIPIVEYEHNAMVVDGVVVGEVETERVDYARELNQKFLNGTKESTNAGEVQGEAVPDMQATV